MDCNEDSYGEAVQKITRLRGLNGTKFAYQKKRGDWGEGHKHLQSCLTRQVEVESIPAGGTAIGKDIGVKIWWLEGIG